MEHVGRRNCWLSKSSVWHYIAISLLCLKLHCFVTLVFETTLLHYSCVWKYMLELIDALCTLYSYPTSWDKCPKTHWETQCLPFNRKVVISKRWLLPQSWKNPPPSFQMPQLWPWIKIPKYFIQFFSPHSNTLPHLLKQKNNAPTSSFSLSQQNSYWPAEFENLSLVSQIWIISTWC